MTEVKKQFPIVQINSSEQGLEGIIGMALHSIQAGELILDSSKNTEQKYLDNLHPAALLKEREALLFAMTGWQSGLALEYHFAITPNLRVHSQSRLLITLCLRHQGPNEQEIKETLYSHYLSLRSILPATIKEAEFAPVTELVKLAERISTSSCRHGLVIKRRRQQIELSHSLTRNSIGFASNGQETEQSNHVADHIFPFLPSHSDWSDLFNLICGQLNPVHLLLKIQPTSLSDACRSRVSHNISRCERFLAGLSGNEIVLQRQANTIRDQGFVMLQLLEQMAFKLSIAIISDAPINNALGQSLGHAITRSQFSGTDFEFLKGGFVVEEMDAEKICQLNFFSENEPVSLGEAAAAFRLPSPPIGIIPGLPVRRYRTSLAILPAQSQEPNNNNLTLFDNIHHGIRQPVNIELEDRLRHMFLLGQTGVGKSNLMKSMIIEDIVANRGVAVIDPHGDLVNEVIDHIPAERAEDVIIFDLLDTERPLGLNLLEWRTIEERDLLIDDLYLTLDRVYDMHTAGGPMFELHFRGMLQLLIGDHHRPGFTPTILDFARCYQDDDFRKWLTDSVEDEQILDFVKEIERAGGDIQLQNIAPYVTSKLSRFRQDTILKRIIGQPKTSFNIEKIMAEGKILLVKLGKGRFGAATSAILANHLVSRFKMATMKRGNLPMEERREFFLYVDEAHNLPGENFMELLSEARKYRMGLVLATQYLSQLRASGTSRRGDNLLSAIIGNVGTMLTFRLGHEDAKELGPTFHPAFTSYDITNLPNFQGYARMQMAGEASQPFSFQTRHAESGDNQKRSEKIIQLSRLKYGKDAKLVEAEIRRRRQSWKRTSSNDQDDGISQDSIEALLACN